MADVPPQKGYSMRTTNSHTVVSIRRRPKCCLFQGICFFWAMRVFLHFWAAISGGPGISSTNALWRSTSGKNKQLIDVKMGHNKIISSEFIGIRSSLWNINWTFNFYFWPRTNHAGVNGSVKLRGNSPKFFWIGRSKHFARLGCFLNDVTRGKIKQVSKFKKTTQHSFHTSCKTLIRQTEFQHL